MNKLALVRLAIVRIGIVSAALMLAPAIAFADPGTAITVPWVDGNPNIYHVTWSGTAQTPHYVTVKGIVRGGSPTKFSWDFGDGTASCGTAAQTGAGTLCSSAGRVPTPITTSPSTIWNLGMKHNYVGQVGQLFIATLYVTDGTTVSSATYPIQIQAMTSPNPAQPADPSQMDVKVEVAEDEALWALHIAQIKDSSTCNESGAVNVPCGYWPDEQGGCAAVEAFELHGSTPSADYANDPYVETVQRGLNRMFSYSARVSSATKIQSGVSSDANGNGRSIWLSAASNGAAGDDTYIDGICGASLAASASPNLTAATGPSGVINQTYGTIMQDVVDWFAYGQTGNGANAGTNGASGYAGGWWYAANYGSEPDGSTNQWPIVAMTGAQQKMGSTIPSFVKATVPIYLNTIHDTVNDGWYGGYGYQTYDSDTNVAKTGGAMMGLFFTGQTNSNTDILKGMGFMYNRWQSPNGGGRDDYNLGASYAMYDVMKAMQAANPPYTKIVQWSIANNAQTSSSFDWYYSPAGQSQPGLAATVLAQQNQSTFMFSDAYMAVGLSATLNTAWDTLILMRALSTIPPKAVICNCSAQWPVNSPVTFDGTCSVEPDTKRIIYDPSGYTWDYNYNGVNFVQSVDSNNLPVQGSVVTNPAGYPKFTEDGNGNPLTGSSAQTYTVALRVTDDTGQSNVTTCNVNIKPPPHCPQANTGGPYNGFASVPVQFNATGSTQVDGDPLTYAWDFHNLNNFTDSTLAQPTHIWASATPLPDGGACTEPACTVSGNGTYPIELEVTNHPPLSDAGVTPGCTETAYTTVIIGDHNPVASAGGPYTGLASGDNVVLDATASYDPDKNKSGLTYAWDLTGRNLYGDSTSSKPTFVIPANTVVGTSFPVCVRVTDVSDASGKTLTSSSSCTTVAAIHVYEPPTCVVAPVSVQSCNGGFQGVTVDGSHSSDPNGDHFTFAWSSSDCPSFDTPAASKSNITFSTAQGGKFFTPSQAACIPACTATLTVTNARGLSSSCSQAIQISDLLTPSFSTAPASTTIECNANAAANVAAWLSSAAGGDLCTPPNRPTAITNNFLSTSGACGGVGTSGGTGGSVAVTFTATDPCDSKSSQSTATLTVSDTQPPVLTLPANISVEATSPSGAAVSYTATALDAATGVTAVTCSQNSGTTFPVGVTTVTCSSTDIGGHRASGSFTVTVTDTTPPALTLPANMTLEATSAAGAVGTFTATATDIVDGSVTPTCAPASGSTFALGTTLVTCTVTDKHNNTASGKFSVKVQDLTAPVVTGPGNLTVEATSGAGAIATFTATATDAVTSNLTVTCAPASGTVFAIGTTQVTCSATDTAGNTGKTQFNVTVRDTTAPAISVPANQTIEATSAVGATYTYSPAVTASDAVDGATVVTCSPVTGSNFAIGTTTVTCSTSDSHGNSSSQQFTVTVRDTTAPVLTVPANMIVESQGPSGSPVTFTATATDTVDPNPAVVCAPASGSVFANGVTTVTCSATDAHANKSTQSFTVTVQDTTGPVLTLSANLTLEATSSAGAVGTFSATASDTVNGSTAVSCTPASGSTFAIKTTTVNCTTQDAQHNVTTGSFTVTVRDTTAPVVTVPANKTIEATSASGATVTFTSTSTDAVDGAPAVTCAPASGSTFAIGTTTVTCSATDAHGNKGTNSFTVLVQDTTAPVVTVPANLIVEATSANGAIATFTSTASDIVNGSTPVTCTPASGSTFAIATTTVTCTSTDGHSNTGTNSFTVTVRDTTPPVLTVPANIVSEATKPGGAVVTFAATSADAVSGAPAVNCAPLSGTTFALGATTVTCSTQDAHSNSSTKSFTVTVRDTTPPAITVPQDMVVEATGAAGAVATYSTSATDIVSGTTAVTCVPASGSTFKLGPTTVTCTSTDAAHNIGTQTFKITVGSTIPPTVSVPRNIVAEATGPNGAPETFMTSAVDIVDGYLPAICVPASGSTFAIGTTTVTCTSTDSSANTGAASFTVTITDSTPPALSGVSSGGTQTVEATGPSGATVVDYNIKANDIVDGALAVSCSPMLPMIFPLGETPVACTSTDMHGNTGRLTFSVDVVDTTPPAVVCPADISVAANGPLGATNWNVAEPTSDALAAFFKGASATDLVDPAPSMSTDAPWMFSSGSTTTVTFSATDGYHNTGTCTAHVTVYGENDWAPKLTCPAQNTIVQSDGMDLDWSAVFRHPVSVQLLLVNAQNGTQGSPITLAEGGDRQVQVSSSALADGVYGVRIRAMDTITGMSVDCNELVSVSNSPQTAKKVARSTIPAVPIRQ